MNKFLLLVPLILISCTLFEEERPFTQTINPLHKPVGNKPAPDTVVVIDLENRYEFDLIPRSINGYDLKFNELSSDNLDEPLNLKTGRIRFVIKNTGTISHNLRIQNYKKDPMEPTTFDMSVPSVNDYLLPGESTEFELNLWTGKFMLTCAITNHDERGMYRPMIVDPEIDHPDLILN